MSRRGKKKNPKGPQTATQNIKIITVNLQEGIHPEEVDALVFLKSQHE